MEAGGWGTEALRARYDGVLHLVSAAMGAEEHYSGENNAARRESVEEARVQDERIRGCWLGHPGFTLISNRGYFERKARNCAHPPEPRAALDDAVLPPTCVHISLVV